MMSSSLKKLACLVIVSFFFATTCEGLRILGLFPLQGKSHFVMCEPLMKALAERGHQVDVYSHFPLEKPVQNYTDYSLAGSIFSVQNNMSFEFFQRFTGTFSAQQMIDTIGNPVCELMNLPIFQQLLQNPPTNPAYDLVITDHFISNCYLAWGRYLNVPLVVLTTTTTLFEWANGPVGNPVDLATDASPSSGLIAPMSFFERIKNVLNAHYVKWTFNYYVHREDEIVKKLFGSNYPDAVELQKDISLVLLNDHHALNGVRPRTPGVVPVGGLHIADTDDQSIPKEVQKFLDDSKDGFVYFSFGSMVLVETFPTPILDAFYKTFEKISPVRVLMKVAKPEKLPPGLPSNVITHHWLPQVKVLKHKNIKAFITHGGLMGTQESIYHGVPMVGFPLFGDQHLNIESYVKRNLAVKLDWQDFTELAFTEAVLEILQNPVYKKSTEKVGALFRDTPMSPIETAIFWIEYIARHGKDALRSPSVDMYWWQSSLLDVYAFIISTILLALLIIKCTIKKFISLLFTKKSLKSNSKVKKN